jgi:hypothetical protein
MPRCAASPPSNVRQIEQVACANMCTYVVSSPTKHIATSTAGRSLPRGSRCFSVDVCSTVWTTGQRESPSHIYRLPPDRGETGGRHAKNTDTSTNLQTKTKEPSQQEDERGGRDTAWKSAERHWSSTARLAATVPTAGKKGWREGPWWIFPAVQSYRPVLAHTYGNNICASGVLSFPGPTTTTAARMRSSCGEADREGLAIGGRYGDTNPAVGRWGGDVVRSLARSLTRGMALSQQLIGAWRLAGDRLDLPWQLVVYVVCGFASQKAVRSIDLDPFVGGWMDGI